MTSKKELRKAVLSMRRKLDDETVALNSQVICRKIIGISEYEEAENLCIYMPINNEVDVTLLAEMAKEDGKRVWIPKIITRHEEGKAGKMVFNEYLGAEEDNFQMGEYKILESKSEDILEPGEKTLILMPGAVFTPWRDRIGYGGGFYDRFLDENPKCSTIAVCHSLQIVDEIETDEFDKKPDFIVTETSIYR